ncbi:MAG: acyltransferase, partial [Lentisphaeria bacterium]|nr:acyltransferase [Lentisphaeria bacterium]
NKTIHEQGMKPGRITIEDDVWIAGGVHINSGVTIGRGSVIGAGAVVTKDIPPMSVAVGVPAKVIKKRG